MTHRGDIVVGEKAERDACSCRLCHHWRPLDARELWWHPAMRVNGVCSGQPEEGKSEMRFVSSSQSTCVNWRVIELAPIERSAAPAQEPSLFKGDGEEQS